MGAGKAHRKKRISKHVIEARKKREEETSTTTENEGETTAVDGAAATAQQSPMISSTSNEEQKSNRSKKKNKKNRKVKDPAEAASYLSAWKHRSAAPGTWKFNKNTQSWLVRHMYDASKVTKATFAVLIDYLAGMPRGAGTRSRVRDDATRRALRYKAWEKERPSGEDAVGGAADETVGPEDGGSGKGGRNGDRDAHAAASGDGGGEDDADDEKRWHGLSAHDKRREYKRARKVLDALKSSDNGAESHS